MPDDNRTPADSPVSSNIFAIVEGIEVCALVDSGSFVSIVSEDFRNSHPALKKRPMTASSATARSVNGQCLDILGKLTIGLRLGKQVWQQEFEVLRGAYQPVILGWDFLEKHHALLDLRNKMLQLWDMKIPLLSKGHEVAACCNVSVLAPTKIPAMSETLITACVSPATPASPVPTDYCGVLMPNPACDIVVAHSLSEVQNGTTVVRVLNPSRDDIELYSGQHLGEFHSASSVDIMPVGKTCAPSPVNDLVPPVQIHETNLSPSQAQSLKSLLQKYSTVFSKDSEDRGRTGIIKHHIRTGDAAPIKQRAYRVTPEQRAEIQTQVENLLKADVIEESYSPWAAPVVLVRKKNGTWRFCLDYRKLNMVTIKDSHPLPRVDDALDALSGSAWFSTVDLQHGYWQVELEEADREKTAFTTGSGLYHFKVMPMGLTNAPATCQRLMEMVLRGLPWKTCLVYLDDVLIYSRSFDEHLQHLEEILSRFQTNGLKLNPSKCCFARDQVQFLGHVVSKNGIQPDPQNVKSVQDWPTPRSATEVRAFLGLCSYYRKFIRSFAHHSVPLHALTEKNAPFQWTSQCQDAFTYLKHALSNPPVVTFPDFSLPFSLYTDASCSAIGAVLSQRQGHQDKVIAYASHVLTKAERKWSTYDRELWAIVWAVRHFRHYLYKQPFVIVTDHKPLLGLRKIPIDNDRTGRRARWALELDPFEWTVIHKNGHCHLNADAMSRRPADTRPTSQSALSPAPTSPPPDDRHSHPMSPSCPVSSVHHYSSSNSDPKPVSSHQTNQHSSGPALQCATPVVASTFVLQLPEEDLQKEQQHDPILSEAISWKTRGQKPPYWRMKKRTAAEKALWQEYHRLTFHNGLLCRNVFNPSTKSVLHQVVVPHALKDTVLQLLHGNPVTGHLSADKVLKRAQQLCYWPFMSRDIKMWCKQCTPCDARRSPTPHQRAPMKTIVATEPFQKVAADILELPITSHGNRYVLVVQDYFSKYVNLYAIPDQRSTTVAKCLFENYICEHGIPEMLHTDQGRQFESDLVKHLCELLGIQKTRTSPYHPQCDGMIERFNRTLIDQLAKSLLQQPGEWDDCLNQVALAYNTSPHSTTGFTPFFLTHGHEARMPANLLLPNATPSSSTPGSPADYVAQLTQKLQSAFSSATWNRDCAHTQQKQQYDKNVKHTPYVSGDLVWLNDPTTSKQKLAPHWKGPFEILECLGSHVDSPGVTYRIHYLLDQSGKSQIVHYNRLRPYNAPVPDRGHQAPASDSSLQPHLPPLTALSGALPFKPLQSAAVKSHNIPGRSSAPPLAPQICQPGPQSQPEPQPRSPLSVSSQTQPLTVPPSELMVHHSDTVPSVTFEQSSGSSLLPTRRQVRPPRYLLDYVRK